MARIIGDLFNNEIFGTNNNDLIEGRAGNDSLRGRDGNDTLLGQTGNDSLDGNDNNDFLYGGSGDDDLFGGDGNDFLNGETGNDTLNGYFGNNTLYGGLGNDSLSSSIGNDLLNGGFGNDDLFSSDGNDTLYGWVGNDSLDSYFGNDIVYGWTGNDSISGSRGNDLLYGEIGNDSLDTGSDDDFLYGGSGNDDLFGGSENDIVNGGTGNDTLNGYLGNDILIGTNGNNNIGTIDSLRGGSGTDFFILTNGRAVFYNNNRVASPGLRDYASIEDFDPDEDLIVLKGQISDYFLAVSPFDNSNNPETGIYYDSDRNGSYSTTTDELIAIAQNADELDLGANYFSYITNASISDAVAVEGINRFANFTVRLDEPISDAISFRYTTVKDTATGLDYAARTGFVTFAPGQTRQTIRIPILNNNFNELNETFRVVLSYPLNPTVTRDVGVGVISDTLRSSVSRTLPRLAENLTLIGNKNINGIGNANSNIITGNNRNNRLLGLAGNDYLNGGAGDDTLTGNTGNDVLVGNFGNDIISGGAGSDRIVFNSRTQRIDTITDFAPVADTIVVSARRFGGGLRPGVLAESQFHLGTAAADRSARFIYNQTSGILSFDPDGSGGLSRTAIALLDPGLPMTHGDIVVA